MQWPKTEALESLETVAVTSFMAPCRNPVNRLGTVSVTVSIFIPFSTSPVNSITRPIYNFVILRLPVPADLDRDGAVCGRAVTVLTVRVCTPAVGDAGGRHAATVKTPGLN